ncbi:MAG: hypothetical protein KAS32_16560 [Candidatus Peribacteraceae bacterium]|nr:hypothetical protein [Candidatus Peribacteraceae bacterium]
MGIIPRNLSKEIRFKFKQLKTELQKPITIYTTPQKQDCPNCLSGYSGEGTGTFDSTFTSPVEIFGEVISPQFFSRIRCPVCKNKGYLEYEASSVIQVIIHWNPPAEMSQGEMIQGSFGLEGKNVVRIKADKCYYNIIRDCEYVEIDGIKCELHLPPTIRHIGKIDVMVTAYFVAIEVGHDVRDT